MQAIDLNTSRLATEVETRERAAKEERKAACMLFANVVEMTKPCLRSIGDHAKTAECFVSGKDKSDRAQRTVARFVALSADDLEPYCRTTAGDEFRGEYEGRKLAVRQDGILCMFVFAGNMSRWQGSVSKWTAKVTTYGSIEAAVEDGWTDVEVYVNRIAVRIERAIGGQVKATEKSRKRAAKLLAAAVLLSK